MTAESADSVVHGIFLLYEGLPRTIIESQVLSHAAELSRDGIEMEVWAFAVTSEAHAVARELRVRLVAEHGVPILVVRGFRPALPFSRQLNALLLLALLSWKRRRPQFIHARTDYSAAVAAAIKPLLKFRLIWDARGDTAREFEEKVIRMNAVSRWLAPVKRRAIRRRLRIVAAASDRALFVSEELRKLQAPDFPDDRALVVPSVASAALFHFDADLRRKIRAELGFGDRELVLLYSGSDAHWQCVPETVDLMSSAVRARGDVRALIVTAQPDSFRRLVPEDVRERLTITTGTLHQMNGFLNAADVGLILRKENPLNWVASPVKFAEYSLAGLAVAATGAVQQIVEFGGLLGNLIEPSLEAVMGYRLPDVTERARRAAAAARVLSRASYANRLPDVYRS